MEDKDIYLKRSCIICCVAKHDYGNEVKKVRINLTLYAPCIIMQYGNEPTRCTNSCN